MAWTSLFTKYSPPDFTAPQVLTAPWADPLLDAADFKPTWNGVDKVANVNRKSYEGEYQVTDGRPLNIRGRTGLKGRGLLGRWGPNHAADPVVTRYVLAGVNEKLCFNFLVY